MGVIMVSEAIYRHEFKYPINACDCEILKSRLTNIMKLDPHADKNGEYVIRSLYFDNFEDKAFFEKINGVNPRAKFRIRIYNGSDKYIMLEKKVKMGDFTQKIQAILTREQCDRITSGDINWMRDDGRGLIAELYAQMKGYALKPKTLVEYTRNPFIYDAGNVRVTLDRRIRSGAFTTDLFTDTPMVYTGTDDILEVKYDNFLPEIIQMVLYPISRTRTSMSKYTACRAFG